MGVGWERRWSGEPVSLSGQLSWRKRMKKKTAHKFIFSFQTTQLLDSWDLIEYFSKRWLGSKAGLRRQTGILYVLQIKLSYDFYTTFFSLCLLWHGGFTGGLSGKESPCKAGDMGLIPGLGRSHGEGNGNPFQYSCLGNPMDRRAWQATAHGVTKESNMT